jgi:hypothetical protein
MEGVAEDVEDDGEQTIYRNRQSKSHQNEQVNEV